MAAVTAAGAGCPRAASPRPTAAPNSGPSSTFCGRIPSRPPRVPVAAPTTTGPAPVSRSAAHPSGATSAALVAIRAHSGGISPGRCRARATASQAASAAAPATAPTPAARGPRCPVSAAPATPPMTPATTTPCFRSPCTPRSSAATLETYRPGRAQRSGGGRRLFNVNGNVTGLTGNPGEVHNAAGADVAAVAVTGLFRAHHLELVRLAVLMTGDLAAAEDVVQDAFEQLHRRWPSLQRQGSGLAYVRSSVLNGWPLGPPPGTGGPQARAPA